MRKILNDYEHSTRGLLMVAVTCIFFWTDLVLSKNGHPIESSNWLSDRFIECHYIYIPSTRIIYEHCTAILFISSEANLLLELTWSDLSYCAMFATIELWLHLQMSWDLYAWFYTLIHPSNYGSSDLVFSWEQIICDGKWKWDLLNLLCPFTDVAVNTS